MSLTYSYLIEIKNEKGKLIKIRFYSAFAINKQLLNEKYLKIINALFDYYYADLVRNYLRLFKNSLEFDLQGIIFIKEGVYLRKNSDLIEWSNLRTKNYWSYFTLFHKANPNNYKAYQYLEDWNAIVLYSVVSQILKEKNLIAN